MPAGEPRSRDYLFINYAVEDEDLAKWLAIKLTVFGYRVWFDQFELLGGESFSRDIDVAIKARAFRMLSVLSKDSANKPNPSKERQTAFNVGKAAGIDDFVIPIRAADLAPLDLNWQVSDLSWIDFSKNWADGFRKLLKKLESIDAPRHRDVPTALVERWFEAHDQLLSRRPEQLMSNIVEFLDMPEVIYLVRAAGELPLDWPPVGQGSLRDWTPGCLRSPALVRWSCSWCLTDGRRRARPGAPP